MAWRRSSHQTAQAGKEA